MGETCAAAEGHSDPGPVQAAVAACLPLEIAELLLTFVSEGVNGSIELHFREGQVRAFRRVEHRKVAG